MTPQPAFQRGQLYWAVVSYLPEKPLDILHRSKAGEVRVAITFKPRPVLIVQNDLYNSDPRHNYLVVAPVHSLKASDLAKLHRVNYPYRFRNRLSNPRSSSINSVP